MLSGNPVGNVFEAFCPAPPWPFAAYNKDAITGFKIVSQASKVGISLEGEVVFTEGYGVESVDGWKDLFRELT